MFGHNSDFYSPESALQKAYELLQSSASALLSLKYGFYHKDQTPETNMDALHEVRENMLKAEVQMGIALQFFELATHNFPYPEPEVPLEKQVVKWKCDNCGNEYHGDSTKPCPYCGCENSTGEEPEKVFEGEPGYISDDSDVEAAAQVSEAVAEAFEESLEN